MYLILVALAAFFYAVHEKIQHHYSNSIFFQWKPLWFWDPAMWDKSWKIFNYRFDARHISASVMAALLCAGCVLSRKPSWQVNFLGTGWQMIVCFLVWICVFNTFFNKIFAKKK